MGPSVSRNHVLSGESGDFHREDGVDLSFLVDRVSTLGRDHPLRVVVARLPKRMPFAEFAALLPSLWSFAEVGP